MSDVQSKLTELLHFHSGSALDGGVFAALDQIAAGVGQMPGNVVIIDRADPVEQQSARALSLVSIAHTTDRPVIFAFLVGDVIDRVPGLGARAAYVKQAIQDALIEHKRYIVEYGADRPEIREWRWGQPGASREPRSSTEADNV